MLDRRRGHHCVSPHRRSTARFFHVHVHQLTGLGPLVADRSRLRGPVTSPVIGSTAASRGTPVEDQHPGHRAGRLPRAGPIQAGHRRARVLMATLRSPTSVGVRVGLVCGRLDRSARPASRWASLSVIQVRTLAGDSDHGGDVRLPPTGPMSGRRSACGREGSGRHCRDSENFRQNSGSVALCRWRRLPGASCLTMPCCRQQASATPHSRGLRAEPDSSRSDTME